MNPIECQKAEKIGLVMRTLNFALIGCGMLGRVHARSVASLTGARFSAFCDVSLETARACQSEFGGDYATNEVSQIWRDDAIDAVYICTRHDSHAPLAIAAARAGKHIFLEKPMALCMDDCDAMRYESEAARVVLMPAFKFRFYLLAQKAHDWIPSPQLIVAQIADERWPDGHWAQDPLTGGGGLLSQGCHATDLMRFFAACDATILVAVGGALTHPGHACPDHCAVSLQWQSGSIGSFVQGDSGLAPLTGKFFFQIFGAGKSVQLWDRLQKATFFDGETSWTETREQEDGFDGENREFIAALQQGRSPQVSARDGVEAMRLIFAAQQAMQRGQRVIF